MHSRAADLAADTAGAAAGDPWAHTGALPAAGQVARYLATQRDPRHRAGHQLPPVGEHGQLPRWDRALARIDVAKPGRTPAWTPVGSRPSQRPTDWDYDRYLWLVSLLRKYQYDDAQIYRHYPFLIKDVFFSAVLVSANAALLDLAMWPGQ